MTATPQRSVQRTDLVTLSIDGIEVSVPPGTLVIRAAEQVGIQIPRFCDHPLLEPVGACRQCLVEVAMPGPGGELRQMQGPPGRMKPQASCTLTVAPGMQVNTQLTSPGASKSQQGVMEFLLINHPLDCPVCDKGGECPLQNQAMSNGRADSRFSASGGVKRTFPKPINISAQVLLDRERCVLCARCTRFSAEISGDPFIALVERGALQQVGIYETEPYDSYFSGNTIQICPVGALTSVEYRFRARPFDLVSTPGVAEHDACGAAIRVDHRRGKVMRRLAGNDPEVNEEWITDKDRFAFNYARGQQRLTYPQVRDQQSGELRPASWQEAFAVAAEGLGAAQGAGVLTGGRLACEDAYAYAKFARVALGTHDIDFRSRVHSPEEADFLASVVALQPTVSYDRLDRATKVVLVGLETEEEAGTLFLRLRKAVKAGLQVVSLASWTSPGLAKLSGRLVPTVPGTEARELRALASEDPFDADTVLLLGERLAGSRGALSTAVELAAAAGADLAWVPRRAGDRGAVEAGCLPNLMPGGRPVADPGARVDLAAAWGVDSLPDAVGRDGDGIVDAVLVGDVDALVVGGVDPADTADPAAFRAALSAARFVVALELNATEVTQVADVVFPVAPVVEKAGTFITWDARGRDFEAIFEDPRSLPDLRVLAGIAEAMAKPLGFRTTQQVRDEMAQVGPWDGARVELATGEIENDVVTTGTISTTEGGLDLVLSTWSLMLGTNSMLAGSTALLATARRPVARLGASAHHELGEPEQVTLQGDRGQLTLPVEVADVVDGTVWVPARSSDAGVLAVLASPGSRVRVTAAGATRKGAEL